MYVTESKYGYGYSDSCKTCSFFYMKILDEQDVALCYKEGFKETIYFCKKSHYYLTESGKLPSVIQCDHYEDGKFINIMKEIIRKDEE
jgi:hypothetical protein